MTIGDMQNKSSKCMKIQNNISNKSPQNCVFITLCKI